MSQALIVTRTLGNNPRMAKRATPPPATQDAKTLFAARLNSCCDTAKIPPKGKNRQAIVAGRFSVTQKGARKWLEGEGLPTLEKAIEIAISFKVAVEWLLTGRGPKEVPEATKPVLVPPEAQALAERIAALSPERRELLMSIFSSQSVTDTDPRLHHWKAPDTD